MRVVIERATLRECKAWASEVTDAMLANSMFRFLKAEARRNEGGATITLHFFRPTPPTAEKE